jgi:hypothetical protein
MVARWTPLARDGADLPAALHHAEAATIAMGPGQTADFAYVPDRPGELQLEVWIATSTGIGLRVAVPIVVEAPKSRAP